MTEQKRFIVIDVADVDKDTHGWVTNSHMASKWIMDMKTDEQWWGLGYDAGYAEEEAKQLNEAKYPDLILELRGTVLEIDSVDKLLQKFTAPLLARIAELEKEVRFERCEKDRHNQQALDFEQIAHNAQINQLNAKKRIAELEDEKKAEKLQQHFDATWTNEGCPDCYRITCICG